MSGHGVITGLGIVSSMGCGHAAFWARLLEGAAPETAARSVRPGVPAPAKALTLPDRVDGEEHLDPRALRKVSELSRHITVAAALCLEDAGLDDAGLDDSTRQETGVCIGTCFGSSAYHLEYHEALRRDGVRGASALLFTQSVFNAPPGHVGQVFGLRGSNLTVVGGESAGLEAVLRGATRVASGADLASLAGGGEQYSDMVHASLHQTGLVGDGATAPVFSAGAVLALLENAADARARGARAYASVLGIGFARRSDPSCKATVREAAHRACVAADLEPALVDLTIAVPPAGPRVTNHLEAITALGGDCVTAPTLPLGAGFAWTSALGAALGALSLHHRVVPPTPGHPALPTAPAHPVSRSLAHVLVVATTSCGTAAAMLLGAAPDAP